MIIVSFGLIKFQETEDDEVNKELLFRGFRVIRFWGTDIKKHTDECVKVIEEMMFDIKLEQSDL